MSMKPAIVLLALLLPAGVRPALAAPSGLLFIGELSQWVDLEYQYDSQKTKGTDTFSRTQNYFREEYNIQTAYAIMDTRIWRGKLSAGFGLDQTYSSATNSPSRESSGRNIKYHLTGAVIERSPFPIHFFTQSELTHAQRDFTAPYDIQLDTFGFNLGVKNLKLPVRINYTRSTTETSGLSSDRVTDSSTLSLEATHKMADISETTAHLNLSESQSKPKGAGSLAAESRTYEAGIRNKLRFAGEDAERSLTSSALKREEARESGVTRSETRTWVVDELLSYPLGKALDLGAAYSFLNQETLTADDTYHTGRVWAQHKLFDSLVTRIEGAYRKEELTGGDETSASGYLGLFYQKLLPRESQLQLNFSQFYQETDRDQVGLSNLALDEPHTVTAGATTPGFAAPVTLNKDNAVVDSIEIRNADATVRVLPYQLNLDYTILQLGTQTRVVILPGSEINLGDNLLITYSYLANPQVAYSTGTRTAGFNLPLFNYNYRFYGNWLQTEQKLLSGEASLVRLIDQTSYKLGFETVHPVWSAGTEYESVDSDQDRHRTLMGFARSTMTLRGGALSLFASDGYTRSEPNSFTGSGQSTKAVNSFSAGGTYSATVLGAAQLLLTSKYNSLRGDTVSRDDISLGCNLQMNLGRVVASLLSQYNWSKQSDTTSQDQFVKLQLTRYF